VFCTTGPGAVVGVCAAIEGSTAESVPVLGVAEAPVPEGFKFPVGRLVPLDPLDDPLLPLDPLLEPLEPDEDDVGFFTVSGCVPVASVTRSSLLTRAVTLTVPLFTEEGIATVMATWRVDDTFVMVKTRRLLTSQLASAPRLPSTVSSAPLTAPPLGVSTTSKEAFAPGAVELGTLAKVTFSFGGCGLGVLVEGGSVAGLVVGGFVGGFGVVGPGDVLGVVADASGVGDGVSTARATGAVPLTRTSPVPTQMISGFRTDRASTAHDLLNNRL
jgi:hypothetical protein